MDHAIYESDFGFLDLKYDDFGEGEVLTALHLLSYVPEEKGRKTDFTKKCFGQLQEYFQGKRQKFDIPCASEGTVFQKKVWDALLEIPYGKTVSYKEIAQKIGDPRACRAVGGANNKNPIPIIIPCHRVIGSNGSLVGYAYGTDIKRRLLELELRNISKSGILMNSLN